MWPWKHTEKKMKWKAKKKCLEGKSRTYFDEKRDENFSWTCHALFHRLFSFPFEFLKLVDATAENSFMWKRQKKIFLWQFSFFHLSSCRLFKEKKNQAVLLLFVVVVWENFQNFYYWFCAFPHRHKSAFLELIKPGRERANLVRIRISAMPVGGDVEKSNWCWALYFGGAMAKKKRPKANERRKLTNEKRELEIFLIFIKHDELCLDDSFWIRMTYLWLWNYMSPNTKEKKEKKTKHNFGCMENTLSTLIIIARAI